MKQKMMILTALIATIALCSACRMNIKNDKSEPLTLKYSKTFGEIAAFERISIDGVCRVIYVQGDSTSVRARYSKAEDAELISVKSDGEMLQINVKEPKNAIKRKKGKILIYVTSPDLIGVALSGVGSFKTKGPLDTDTLRLNMEGVGSIKIPSLICDRLQANVAGAGSIQLSDVTAQETLLSMNGVGSIKVENFQNSGSVHCTMEGVGSIKLGGEVQNFSNYVNGVGSIDAKDLKIKELGKQ